MADTSASDDDLQLASDGDDGEPKRSPDCPCALMVKELDEQSPSPSEELLHGGKQQQAAVTAGAEAEEHLGDKSEEEIAAVVDGSASGNGQQAQQNLEEEFEERTEPITEELTEPITDENHKDIGKEDQVPAAQKEASSLHQDEDKAEDDEAKEQQATTVIVKPFVVDKDEHRSLSADVTMDFDDDGGGPDSETQTFVGEALAALVADPHFQPSVRVSKLSDAIVSKSSSEREAMQDTPPADIPPASSTRAASCGLSQEAFAESVRTRQPAEDAGTVPHQKGDGAQEALKENAEEAEPTSKKDKRTSGGKTAKSEQKDTDKSEQSDQSVSPILPPNRRTEPVDVSDEPDVHAAGLEEIHALGQERTARAALESLVDSRPAVEAAADELQGRLVVAEAQLRSLEAAEAAGPSPNADASDFGRGTSLSKAAQLRMRIAKVRQNQDLSEIKKRKAAAEAALEKCETERKEAAQLYQEMLRSPDWDEFKDDLAATLKEAEQAVSRAGQQLEAALRKETECEEAASAQAAPSGGAAASSATAAALEESRSAVKDLEEALAKNQRQLEALDRQIVRARTETQRCADAMVAKVDARRKMEDAARRVRDAAAAAITAAKAKTERPLSQPQAKSGRQPTGKPPAPSRSQAVTSSKPINKSSESAAPWKKRPPVHHRKLTTDKPQFETTRTGHAFWPGMPVFRTSTDPAKVAELKEMRSKTATDAYTKVNYRYMPRVDYEILTIGLYSVVERLDLQQQVHLYTGKPKVEGGTWHYTARDKLVIMACYAVYLKENGVSANPFFYPDHAQLRKFLTVAMANNATIKPYAKLTPAHLTKWLLDADLLLLFSELDGLKRMDDGVLQRTYAQEGAAALWARVPAANRQLLGKDEQHLLATVAGGGDWQPLLDALKEKYPKQEFDITKKVEQMTALFEAKLQKKRGRETVSSSSEPASKRTKSSAAELATVEQKQRDVRLDRSIAAVAAHSAPSQPTTSSPRASSRPRWQPELDDSRTCPGANSLDSSLDSNDEYRVGYVTLHDGSKEPPMETFKRITEQVALFSVDKCDCLTVLGGNGTSANAPTSVQDVFAVDIMAGPTVSVVRQKMNDRLDQYFGRRCTLAVVLVEVGERDLTGRTCPRDWPANIADIDMTEALDGNDALLIIATRRGHVCQHAAWAALVVIQKQTPAAMCARLMAATNNMRTLFKRVVPVWSRNASGGSCVCEGDGADTAPFFHVGCRSQRDDMGERTCIFRNGDAGQRIKPLTVESSADRDVLQPLHEEVIGLSFTMKELAPVAFRNMEHWSREATACRVGKYPFASPFSYILTATDGSRHICAGKNELVGGITAILGCTTPSTESQYMVFPTLKQVRPNGTPTGKQGVKFRMQNRMLILAPLRLLEYGVGETEVHAPDFPTTVLVTYGQAAGLLKADHGSDKQQA